MTNLIALSAFLQGKSKSITKMHGVLSGKVWWKKELTITGAIAYFQQWSAHLPTLDNS